MKRWILAVTLIGLATGCETLSHAEHGDHHEAPEYLSPPAMKSLNLPFSDAVRVGDLLFLSGKLGNKPGTMSLAPGGITGETRQ
ncbi:MAG: RidA family protein, partial [Gammaproteobacteria bacterium]